MSARTPVPLRAAAQTLLMSVRSIQSKKRRRSLGLVDAPAPPAGGSHAWVTAESLDRVTASRDAVRKALRSK